MWGVDVLLGRYELIGRLSRSASGAVWKGWDPELQRDVALKQVTGTSPDLRARLAGEATVLASLDHPHIVAVYDLIGTDDDLWLVEEWVDGADVTALVAVAGGLSPVQSLSVLRGALQGLAFAHERGIVHGDVTPGNILVDRQGVSKLVDFGLAGASGRPGIGSGTAGYASPEAAGGGLLTYASDVWSAAAVLTALLDPAGIVPTAPDDRAARLARSGVPTGVRRVLARALDADPTARQPDAGVLLAELEEAGNEEYGPGWWQFAGVAGVVATATTVTLRATDGTDSTDTGVTTVMAAAAVSLLDDPRRLPDVVIGDAVSPIDRVAAVPGTGASPMAASSGAAPRRSASRRSASRRSASRRSASRNVLTAAAAAAVAVVVLLVFLLTRGDETPSATSVLEVPTTSAVVVTSGADATPSTEPSNSPAISAPTAASISESIESVAPTSAAVEPPSISPEPSAPAAPGVGSGFNGVYTNEAVTTAIEGRIIGLEVGAVSTVEWTVATRCEPTCIADVVSSSGKTWTLTESAGVFTLDAPTVDNCFLRPGEPSEGTTTKQVTMTFTPTVIDAGRIRELVGTVVFTQIAACPGQTDPLNIQTNSTTLRLVDA